MIQTENIIINGRQLTRTCSDSGDYIQRDGVRYAEAIDPEDSGRVYTETDVTIEGALAATETEEKAAAYDCIAQMSKEELIKFINE